VRPQELAMAESYISALSADFEPDEFHDDYRGALEEVIQAKVAGREIKAPEEQPRDTGQVVDLMEALRRSVDEAKARRGEGGGRSGSADSEAKKSTAKKAPAKSTTKKTAAKTAKKTTKKSAAKKTTAKKTTAARKSA
jgi:DNA end-binding protein Ku